MRLQGHSGFFMWPIIRGTIGLNWHGITPVYDFSSHNKYSVLLNILYVYVSPESHSRHSQYSTCAGMKVPNSEEQTLEKMMRIKNLKKKKLYFTTEKKKRPIYSILVCMISSLVSSPIPELQKAAYTACLCPLMGLRQARFKTRQQYRSERLFHTVYTSTPSSRRLFVHYNLL